MFHLFIKLLVYAHHFHPHSLNRGIGGGIVGGEVRANLSNVIGGNFNNGIKGGSIGGILGTLSSDIGGSMTSIFSGYIGGTRDDNISSGFGGTDDDIGCIALVSAIGDIGSGIFGRRVGGGIVGIGVKFRGSLSIFIGGHINYGITGGTIGSGIGGNIAGSFSSGMASCHIFSIGGILVSLNYGKGGSLSGSIGGGMVGSFSGNTGCMFGNIRSAINMSGGARDINPPYNVDQIPLASISTSTLS
ncbi:uncharacterized protein LOC141701211 [Apium graveolens]|uniref:uncharacterized protein LOC141701211 n=1 Tax=Apium graveolens TaxID=4045 RepID=UPI003D78C6A0